MSEDESGIELETSVEFVSFSEQVLDVREREVKPKYLVVNFDIEFEEIKSPLSVYAIHEVNPSSGNLTIGYLISGGPGHEGNTITILDERESMLITSLILSSREIEMPGGQGKTMVSCNYSSGSLNLFISFTQKTGIIISYQNQIRDSDSNGGLGIYASNVERITDTKSIPRIDADQVLKIYSEERSKIEKKRKDKPAQVYGLHKLMDEAGREYILVSKESKKYNKYELYKVYCVYDDLGGLASVKIINSDTQEPFVPEPGRFLFLAIELAIKNGGFVSEGDLREIVTKCSINPAHITQHLASSKIFTFNGQDKRYYFASPNKP